ncbi:MAG: hypothetical protein IJW03_03425 [Clostridia bacterium]|nr:hypothetical protein [Clostridia bacterium]
MKKIILTIITICAISMALVSCEGLFGNDNNGTDPAGEKQVYRQIIIENTDLNILEARLAITDITGMIPTAVFNDSEKKDGEIVFGNTDREVTSLAKEALLDEISKSTKYDCGYIIYCDGKNVAIYWQLDGMDTIAIADFVKKCVTDKRLVLTEGVCAVGLYKKTDYENERYWLALSAMATEDEVSALRSLYSYYEGEKIVDWMANLYDPDRGAFYYSISARDNAGFLPDVESTRQVTQLIASSGGMKHRNDLPAEIKEKILEFTLNMQSPTDGYFYHEQWAQDKSKLNTDRYGRDISSALGIISDLNIDLDGDGIEDDVYPLYCAPNGTKCARHYGKDEECSFPVATSYYTDRIAASVTTSLTEGVSAAVSRAQNSYVSATAVSSHPDYSSREAFRAWLLEYNASIKEDSGKAHNLSAIAGEIRAHGYDDIVVDHLKQVQEEVYQEQLAAGEEPTGLWQRNVNYKAVWGLLKYASYYNNSYHGAMDWKYIPHIINTCIKVIAMPLEDGAVAANDIYNMWQGILRVINHVKTYYGDSKVNEIYMQVRENAAELISNSLVKLEPFKRNDGSFSYRSTGNSLSTIYGTAISLGLVEGDVNAVSLCCQMYEAIYTALGYSTVPLFSRADGERFVDTLLHCESITKKEQKNEIYDFDDGEFPTNISTNVRGPGSEIVITENPDDSSDNVLHLLSNAITSGGGNDYVTVTSYLNPGECYVLDLDMYISSENNDSGYSFQVYYGETFMIAFSVKSNGVNIAMDKSGSGDLGATLVTVPFNTWFRFTMECHMPNDSNGLDTPVARIWIDEEFVAETTDFCDTNGNGNYIEGFTTVKFWSMRKKASNFYFDDIYASKEQREYYDGDEEFTDVRN